MPVIPDAAVEAAAVAVHDEFCRDQYHAGHIGPACYDYKVEALTILEAAAPYLMAQAWDECEAAGYEIRLEDDFSAWEPVKDNPYRTNK